MKNLKVSYPRDKQFRHQDRKKHSSGEKTKTETKKKKKKKFTYPQI